MLCLKKALSSPNPGSLSEQKTGKDINAPKEQCKLTLGGKKQHKYTQMIKCTEYAFSNNQNDKMHTF